MWLYYNFIGWLSFLNATLPPVGAIIALDFFLHRDKYRNDQFSQRTVNWGASIGVVAAALVGNFITIGIAAINGLIVAAVCYLVADKLVSAREACSADSSV